MANKKIRNSIFFDEPKFSAKPDSYREREVP